MAMQARLGRSYIICATQRSGSTLLCDALQATAVAGYPDEYLDPDNVRALSERWSAADPIAYLHALSRRRASANGVFGLKVMYPDMEDFVTKISGPLTSQGALAARVAELFSNPRYMLISRRDKVRQAVSYWRALQTEEWNSLEARPGAFQGDYSFERIASLRRYIEQCERAWRDFFTLSGIRPYRVVYEDFVVSYREATARVLAYLGLPSPVPPLRPRIKKQADSLSDAWVERFRREETERLPPAVG
jgi:trehalose 2-sulfotransferase